MGAPFRPNAWQQRPLTVVLYWRPRGGPEAFQNGHAALIIDSQQFHPTSTDYYASWVATGGGNPFVNAAQQQSFVDDAHVWGGQQVGQDHGVAIHVPTKWVALSCLNIADLKAAWDAMRNKAGAHWKLADKNCASAVARILKAGGGDGYAKSSKSQIVWWPSDLIRYATSMRGGSRRRAETRNSARPAAGGTGRAGGSQRAVAEMLHLGPRVAIASYMA